MNLKQQLMEAAKTIETEVKLDSIFEGADLSTELKTKIEAVFESAVKTHAVKVAETHIDAIAEKAEERVSEEVKKEIDELTETIDRYLDTLAARWLEENIVAVEKNLQSEMFESLMAGMKNIFVENNVEVPSEKVDVVSELEDEIAESREEINRLMKEKKEIKEEMEGIKRDKLVEGSISKLTESQKEKVKELVEGLEYNDTFEAKLSAIVEMTSSKEESTEEVVVAESVQSDDVDPNFNPEPVQEAPKANKMSAYLAAL